MWLYFPLSWYTAMFLIIYIFGIFKKRIPAIKNSLYSKPLNLKVQDACVACVFSILVKGKGFTNIKKIIHHFFLHTTFILYSLEEKFSSVSLCEGLGSFRYKYQAKSTWHELGCLHVTSISLGSRSNWENCPSLIEVDSTIKSKKRVQAFY